MESIYCTTSFHGSGMIAKKGVERIQEPEAMNDYKETVYSDNKVVVVQRPVQAQAKQNPSMKKRTWSEIPHPHAMELLTINSC